MYKLVSDATDRLVTAICAILEAESEKLNLLETCTSYNYGKAKISGIALEFFPGNQHFHIELIPERTRFSDVQECADFGISLGNISYHQCAIPEQKSAIDFVVDEYTKASETEDDLLFSQTVNALFISAASALMDSRVVSKLNEYNISAAPVKVGRMGPFGYFVYDRDKSFELNYCEHVMLNNLTKS